ncbi:MAG: TonB-dependent receptor, partial [Parvularculaceae bacterium]
PVPADLFQLSAAEFGSAAENIVLERRYPELGPREQTVERSHADMTAGARIEPNDRLTAEFSYRFGRTGVRNTQFNRLDRSNFDVALDTSLCAATPGCVPINPFLIGGITEGAGDFLRAPPLHRRIFLEEHELSARVSVDVDGPFPETAYATGGLDLRRTRFGDGSVNPNFGDVGGAFLSNDLKGALSVIEGFAALNAPLLRSSVVGDLDLSIAGRVTGSSQYGPAHNIEAAADWSPTEGLRFFGKAHAGRRPPNIIEMFNVDEAVHATFFDPCGESLTSMSETVAENCFGDGALSVSDGFKQTAPLAKVSFVGNPDLEPERIWSGAYGVAIAPTSMFRGIDGDMRISATWLSHKIENIVGAIEAPLAACYSSPGFSSPACGVNPHTGLPLINRDPTSEQIVAIEWLMMNGAAYKWKGLDFQFDYVIEPAGFGPIDRLWVSGLHTLALRVESTVLGNLTAQRLDGQAADPRNRSRASIGGEAGPIALNLYFQRRGRVATLPGAPFPETKIPAVSTIDLTTRLKIGDKAVATFAVENLTDRDAPLAAFAGGAGGNTFPEHYDLIGRRFSIGLKVAM